MGYLLLSVALLCGATKGFCGKKISGYAENTVSSVLLNLIRMLICIVFSLLLIFILGDGGSFSVEPRLLLISAVSGIGTACFVVSWLLAIRKSAYMMLDVFLMLGTLVPMLVTHFMYSESIGIRRWLGFGILLLAALIMCSYSNSTKTALTPYSFLLLLFCGFANGVADTSQKVFVKSFPELPASVFNFYTYIFAAAALAVFFLFMRKRETVSFERSNSRRVYIYVLIMAVALSANSYFKTLAATYLESARLYPINQAAALILSTLMATVFFKEKLTVRAVLGIALSFVALMLMNL